MKILKKFKDSRGEIINCIYKNHPFNLLFTKKGFFRSGDFHPNRQIDVILFGSVKITHPNGEFILNKDNRFVSIPPCTPHLFEFLEDTLLIEWWDGVFHATYYEPYRKIVEKSIEHEKICNNPFGKIKKWFYFCLFG